jgi:hypothetical protein
MAKAAHNLTHEDLATPDGFNRWLRIGWTVTAVLFVIAVVGVWTS